MLLLLSIVFILSDNLVGSETNLSENWCLGVKFTSYLNYNGTTATGECCDEPGKTAGSCSPDLCDTSFVICVKSHGSRLCDVLARLSTPTTYNNNSVHFGHHIGNKNHIRFSSLLVFKSHYAEKNVDFTIEAIEMNEPNEPWARADIIAKQTFLIDWVDPMFDRHPTFHRFLVENKHAQLVLDIVSMCNEHYYTHNCSVYCNPRATRHNCSTNGTKECHSGWNGKNCDNMIDYCPANKCEHGSTCVPVLNGYTCECTANYTGRHCQIIKPTVPDLATRNISQFSESTANIIASKTISHLTSIIPTKIINSPQPSESTANIIASKMIRPLASIIPTKIINSHQPSESTANIIASKTTSPPTSIIPTKIINSLQPSESTPNILASKTINPLTSIIPTKIINSLQPSKSTENIFASKTTSPPTSTIRTKIINSLQPSESTPNIIASKTINPLTSIIPTKIINSHQPSESTANIIASKTTSPPTSTIRTKVINSLQPSKSTENIFASKTTSRPTSIIPTKIINSLQPSESTPNIIASKTINPLVSTELTILMDTTMNPQPGSNFKIKSDGDDDKMVGIAVGVSVSFVVAVLVVTGLIYLFRQARKKRRIFQTPDDSQGLPDNSEATVLKNTGNESTKINTISEAQTVSRDPHRPVDTAIGNTSL